MMGTIIEIAAGAAIGGGSLLAADRHPAFGVWWFGAWAIVSTALAAVDAAMAQWGWAGLAAASAALGAFWWWSACRKRAATRAP